MAREVLGIAGAAIGFIVGGPAGAQIGFAIGSTVGAIIDPLEIDGPKLGDAMVQTSRDGIPIPIIWGIIHTVGNIIDMNPIVERTVKTGSKKAKVKTTLRFRSYAIGIGRSVEGPIHGVMRVWENNKLIYDVRPGSTFPLADNSAFEAATTMYLGTETQVPDPTLEAVRGVGNTPAYRGLAYIVFIDKDITDFGSSIPSYRFEVGVGIGEAPLETGEGYSFTQYEWFTPPGVGSPGIPGAPDFLHPFRNQSYDEFTMSAVFCPIVRPDWGEDAKFFNIHEGGGGQECSLGVRFRSAAWPDQVYWMFNLCGFANPTDTYATRISAQTIELWPTKSATWLYHHWYWMAVSYSYTTNQISYVCRNLTIGDEVLQTPTITNLIPVAFNDQDGEQSVCAWGRAIQNDTFFLGALSQVVIHNKFLDLNLITNRNKFCCADGIRNIGIQGERIFGEVPLVHLPRGFPQEGNGSIFVGDLSNLASRTEIKRENRFPPRCGG